MRQGDITNVHVGFTGVGGNPKSYSVSCEYRGDRYHYWSDNDDLQPKEGQMLFKGPVGKRSTDPGWYPPRKLKIATNQWMIDKMREYGLANNLVEAAHRKEQESEVRRIAEARKRQAEELLKDFRSYSTYCLEKPLDNATDDELAAALKRVAEELTAEKEKA